MQNNGIYLKKISCKSSSKAKQLSENMFDVKTKVAVHLQMKSNYLNSMDTNRN